MSVDLEELMSEIAQKHGIAITRNDPIMIAYTLNQRLIEDQMKAQTSLLEDFKSENEALAYRWSEDTKEKSEKILTASLEASKKAMLNTMQENALVTANAVKKEVGIVSTRIDQQIKDLRSLAKINIGAAFVTLLAASVALFTILL